MQIRGLVMVLATQLLIGCSTTQPTSVSEYETMIRDEVSEKTEVVKKEFEKVKKETQRYHRQLQEMVRGKDKESTEEMEESTW